MRGEEGRGEREGYTLIEMIVVLAILGLMLGISGVALASLREPSRAAGIRALERARMDAIKTGIPVSVAVSLHDTGEHNAPRTTHLLFLPDGRVVGAGMDILTGASLGTR